MCFAYFSYVLHTTKATATHIPTRTILIGNTLALFYNHLRLSSPLISSSQVLHTSTSSSPFHSIFRYRISPFTEHKLTLEQWIRRTHYAYSTVCTYSIVGIWYRYVVPSSRLTVSCFLYVVTSWKWKDLCTTYLDVFKKDPKLHNLQIMEEDTIGIVNVTTF